MHSNITGIVNFVFILSQVGKHSQKHNRQTGYRLSFHLHGRITPVTIRAVNVDIFVRQIDTARKADSIVNHAELSMIPVVHRNNQCRTHLIEPIRFDSHLIQFPVIMGRDAAVTAKVIIDQFDFNAFLNLLL